MICSNLKKILEHGRRADNIVRGMLLHSRGNPGQREPIDINELLEEYINLAYHGMRAKEAAFNITIERDFGDGLSAVNVVPQDMSRVFLNLVNNACYATHKRSKDAPADYVPTVRVSSRLVDGSVEIRIWDNGTGIPSDIVLEARRTMLRDGMSTNR